MQLLGSITYKKYVEVYYYFQEQAQVTWTDLNFITTSAVVLRMIDNCRVMSLATFFRFSVFQKQIFKQLRSFYPLIVTESGK